ncbi:uncharacterized protein LTR77_001769 [Saxophila tyrrhenica]|uniref:Uncharacterized protein n=1 Tax=Saxophila tyrrhenica TaxID=1690608 RepID=A0AAV9PQT0_9PEZI|nr:hypothetical protein LTR77_001769 [Saxophila tyrrhenica]
MPYTNKRAMRLPSRSVSPQFRPVDVDQQDTSDGASDPATSESGTPGRPSDSGKASYSTRRAERKAAANTDAESSKEEDEDAQSTEGTTSASNSESNADENLEDAEGSDEDDGSNVQIVKTSSPQVDTAPIQRQIKRLTIKGPKLGTHTPHGTAYARGVYQRQTDLKKVIAKRIPYEKMSDKQRSDHCTCLLNNLTATLGKSDTLVDMMFKVRQLMGQNWSRLKVYTEAIDGARDDKSNRDHRQFQRWQVIGLLVEVCRNYHTEVVRAERDGFKLDTTSADEEWLRLLDELLLRGEYAEAFESDLIKIEELSSEGSGMLALLESDGLHGVDHYVHNKFVDMEAEVFVTDHWRLPSDEDTDVSDSEDSLADKGDKGGEGGQQGDSEEMEGMDMMEGTVDVDETDAMDID